LYEFGTLNRTFTHAPPQHVHVAMSNLVVLPQYKNLFHHRCTTFLTLHHRHHGVTTTVNIRTLLQYYRNYYRGINRHFCPFSKTLSSHGNKWHMTPK